MEDFALTLGGRSPVAENLVGNDSFLAGPHFPRDFAARLAAYETLIDAPPTQQLGEPFSLQWFLDVEKQRLSRQGRWIPRVLEFGKHSGERLLGLGHGLGTDWVQYAQQGAHVVVCTPSPMQLQLVRRNFEVRDLSGRFVSADPTRLPLDSNSVDVACLSSLYHGIDHPEAVIDEVFRVLKPGGKVLAVTSARFDVDFWFDTLFFGYRLLAGERRTQRKPGPEHSTPVGNCAGFSVASASIASTNDNCGTPRCRTSGVSCRRRSWPASWAASSSSRRSSP